MSWLHALARWGALFRLYTLVELPGLLLGDPLRPTAEAAALLTGYIVSVQLAERGRVLRRVLAVCATLFAVYIVDHTLLLLAMNQEPSPYDQLFMLRLLLVLIGDLWSWKVVLGVIIFLFTLGACLWLVRLLLRYVRKLAAHPREALVASAFGVLVCVSATFSWLPPGMARHRTRVLSLELLTSLQRSRARYAAVEQRLHHCPYHYGQLKLRRRPDIYLFIVESYGRVLWQREELRGPWRSQLHEAEQNLTSAGWYAASAFSTSPVSGGGSWLADATLLTGIRIDAESVFQHVIGQIEHVPHLVALLKAQGYHAIALAPSDRKRLGVPETNYYGYDRVLRHGDLHYEGPRFGWGIVPDQYSLYFADEHALRSARRPLFVSFHMVSSHTAWEDIPRLVDDWHNLNHPDPRRQAERVSNGTLSRLRAFGDHAVPLSASALSAGILDGYAQTLRYDLQLLERYLRTIPGDALVFVMGDHQPPLISGRDFGFDTPFHVLSRDPALLAEFKAQGFSEGLMPAEQPQALLHHEGLFSLIVRAVATSCGDIGFVPPYLPTGSEP